MPPASPSGRRARALAALHHTRTTMALKTAVAAALSFLLAQQLPGPAQEYAFYAPLGAVVTTFPTMARSLRQALQATGAIALGAGLALVADRYLGHSVVVVGLVVGLAVLLGGMRWLGPQRAYVPITGLFVLVIGQGQELAYAGAYAGLFLLGAAVTVVLHAAFPSFPVRQAQERLDQVRAVLSTHLHYLADRLDTPGDDAPEALTRRGPGRPSLPEAMAEARGTVEQVAESVLGNRRARRRRETVRTQVDTWRAFERASVLVDDLYHLAADEPWGLDLVHLSPQLRGPMATAVRELADAVRTVGLRDREAGSRSTADAAVRALGSAVREHEREGGHEAETLVVSAIITALRRTLSVLTPADRIELPRDPGGASAGHGR